MPAGLREERRVGDLVRCWAEGAADGRLDHLLVKEQ